MKSSSVVRKGEALRQVRPEMQMIFQDPISSLNPRRKVGDIVAEPLRIWASEQHPPTSTVKLAMNALYADAAIRAGRLCRPAGRQVTSR